MTPRLPGIITLLLLTLVIAAGSKTIHSAPPLTGSLPEPQAGTLCNHDEQVIFSCPVKQPAKIVSLCASRNLTKEAGYVQYRFGQPDKIELEFPSQRTGTQRMFHYSHYMRAQFDETQIRFQLNGYEYAVFSDYNGEERPAVNEQGVTVKAPGKERESRLLCRGKAKADFSTLPDVFENEDTR